MGSSSSSSGGSTQIVYYESAESIRIREERAKEERNREAASKELPKFLGIVQNDFSTKLKGKIYKMKKKIDKELGKYSPSNIKVFLQKLVQNEKVKDKLISDSKKESENILNKSYQNSTHFNILLLGKTGVGKSTLINGIFDFKENEGARTGDGKPITQEFEEFTSDKRKGLRFIDSKGIEMGEHNINAVFNSAKQLIEKKAREGDPDKLVHCIWYCFKSSDLLFEDVEKNTLSLLMNQYDDNNLPIIIVITQNYNENTTERMTTLIKDEFKFLNREITIIPVVAKDNIIVYKKKELVCEKDGIKELIKLSFEKSQRAIYPAFMKSIKEKIIETFALNTENKKYKLKNDLKVIIKNISDEIKENEKIENNIAKLSTIIKKTLNIFFEIPKISENSKNEISRFLDNLSKWCIGRLSDIISDLVKDNSNELSLLVLMNKQK